MTISPKQTKSMQLVLSALQQLSHATAQEIVDWLQLTRKADKTSLTSVYRALNQLIDHQHVKPLYFNDGQVRYELNTQNSHHHHLVCTSCNEVQVLDWCPFDKLSEQFHGRFHVHYHNFEIFGRCTPCETERQQALPTLAQPPQEALI